MWKRGEIAPKEQFSSFPHYFIYIFLTSGVKLHIHLLNVVVQFVCVEVLRPSQPNGVMLSAVSLPNHTFTGQA